MTSETFTSQLKRLIDVFGPKAFPEERNKLIFLAIRAMPDFWMESVCNEFISNHRQSPLLKDFIEKIGEYHDEKTPDAFSGCNSPLAVLEKAAELNRGTADPELVKDRIGLLKKFLNKVITKEEFEITLDLIMQAAKEKKKNVINIHGVCENCDNCGYAIKEDVNGYRYVYRCNCLYGSHRPKKAMCPITKDGIREAVDFPQFDGRLN